MASQNIPLLSFNGGEVGRDTLNRVDLEGYGRYSETMENFLPLAQGPMTVRPPFLFQASTPGNASAWLLPFSYNVSQSFLLMFTEGALRIVQDGGVISRVAVSTTIADGDFTSLASWTDIDEVGGDSTQSASNELRLASNDSALAGREQAVTIAGGDLGVTHGLKVVVTRGPVLVRIGSTSGATDILAETELDTGEHRLAFSSAVATIYLRVYSRALRPKYVDSITIEAAGDLTLTSPILEADFPSLRTQQEADVVFIAWGGGQVRRIERHANDSWSFVVHEIDDGPFELENTNAAFTLTPSAVSGEATLTASQPLFQSGHVGGLFAATHTGQLALAALASANTFSDPIRVVGIGTDRAINVTITGTFTATVTLQKSVGNDTDWDDAATYTTATSTTVNDGLDNQIVYYRIGIKSGDYSSGTATSTITNQSGTTTGVARVVGYTSETVVDIDIIEPFAKTDATSDWAEGSISGAQIYPADVKLFDGRLFVGGENKWGGSVPDDYRSFAFDETDAGAIWRRNASGTVNPIRWFLPLARLFMGTEGTEHVIRSSDYDEALTPSNNALRSAGTRGVANVAPVVVDTFGLFIDRTTFRLMGMIYDFDLKDYRSRSMMRLHRRIGKPGLSQIAVARYPDTRIFIVRDDGEMICLLLNSEEDVQAYCRIKTTGSFESVAVLPAQPGTEEDEVYVVVKRTIDGSEVRFLEKLGAIEMEADEPEYAGWMDAAVLYDSTPTSTITGLSHLNGESVVVWADGARQADKTVSGGQITLDSAASVVLTGLLPPPARYKSGKLAYAAQRGTALSQMKRVVSVALAFTNAVRGAIRYGSTFTSMSTLQDRDIETTYDTGPGLVSGETKLLPCPGRHGLDERLCIEVSMPARVTIDYVVFNLKTNEK